MTLNLYVAGNDTHCWVRELRVQDGRRRAECISFGGPPFHDATRTDLRRDINLEGLDARGSACVRIEGLQLTAFAPGTGPLPFDDCRIVEPDDPSVAPWKLDCMVRTYSPPVPGRRTRASSHDLVMLRE